MESEEEDVEDLEATELGGANIMPDEEWEEKAEDRP